MHLQGSLQEWFDILYQAGVIQRMLNQDWQSIQAMKDEAAPQWTSLFHELNQLPLGQRLEIINALPKSHQDIIALEVAHEFVTFEQRKQIH